MKFFCFIYFIVVAILIKENFCVPAIRPLSQRGIIFPVDNWDNCYLDDASTRPGLCKKLEECPNVLKKWDEEHIYPKTCYFIKKQQFVCCPPPASDDDIFTIIADVFNTNTTTIVTEKPDIHLYDIFNTESGIYAVGQESKDVNTTIYRPSNIFLDKVRNKTTTTTKPLNSLTDKTTIIATKKPSNIFLENSKKTTSSTTKRPNNIFLENLNTQKNTSEKSPFEILTKRRSEAECELQKPEQLDPIIDDIHELPDDPNEFPFMAVLGWRTKTESKVWYSCGGVLISSRFILTAAHCAEIGGDKPVFVHLGDKDLIESEEGTIKIKTFYIHPDYNDTTINNDIALVELEEDANNEKACIWTQYDLPIANFIALGYSLVSFGTISSNQLLKTSLTLIDNAECQDVYRLDKKLRNITIVESHLCAGDVENFRHFCHGGTGGPLIVQLNKVIYVVGIASFRLSCAELPPSTYTRVSSFIDWIEPIVWPQIDIRIEGK